MSRDFDTRQLDYANAENAFVPRYLRGTELKQDDIDGFRRGQVRDIAIIGRDGSVNIVPYQYNAVFRKPMEVLTLEQRNALANELRQQRDLERIISTPPQHVGGQDQTPKPTQEQAPATAPEKDQQGQASETVGQEQAPAPTQGQQGQTAEVPAAEPKHGQQTQIPKTAGQGQAPTQGQKSPQGQGQPGAGQKSPRPEVKVPEPKAGRKTGKHM